MSELEGQKFAGFDILAKLGEGGMGAVYRAHQPLLDRLVALKVMAPQLSRDQAFVARFIREAASAAKFHHPNIVQVHTAGEADGHYYIAMEFVEGETLREHIQRFGKLDQQEAIAVTLYVAQGLQYAWHKAQLIHRDIKPDNIFLSCDGEVKVGDLGLAKSMTGEITEVTHTGLMVGSPHYMSPEQAKALKDIDFRADIYSLGCTLYQMLTGRTPFDADEFLPLVLKHLNEPAPNLRTFLPHCPAPLVALVNRMMAKDRELRHGSYGELIDELWSVSELPGPESSVPTGRTVRTRVPTAIRKALPPAPAPSPLKVLPAEHEPRAFTPDGTLIVPRPTDDEDSEVVSARRSGARRYAFLGLLLALVAVGLADWWYVEAGLNIFGSRPSQTLDLLPLIDPAKDSARIVPNGPTKKGAWERKDGRLIFKGDGGSGKVSPPVTLSTSNYEIEFDFARLSGAGRLHLALPLGDGRQLPVYLDAPGLKLINGQGTAMWPAKASSRGRVLVRLAMGGPGKDDHLVVHFNGQSLLDWRGNLGAFLNKTNKLDAPTAVVKQYTPSLFSQKDSYEIRAWKLRVFAGRAVIFRDDFFNQQVASLPAERQIEQVVSRLKQLNPGYDGEEKHVVKGGDIVALTIPPESMEPVFDLSPIRALTHLSKLVIACDYGAKADPKPTGKVNDLSALLGLPLMHLDCSGQPIHDITPLRNMPLKNLHLHGCRQIDDLSPLSGSKLLEWFCFVGTSVRDLSPLDGVPLQTLVCNTNLFATPANRALVYSMPTLKVLWAKPVAEFWKDFDAGKRIPHFHGECGDLSLPKERSAGKRKAADQGK